MSAVPPKAEANSEHWRLRYGLVKREPIIIIGQLASNIIYVRNLMLIYKHHAKGSETLDC